MTLPFDLALVKRLTLNTAATAADITDPDTILLYDTTTASVLKCSFSVLVQAIATAMAATPRAGVFTTLQATSTVTFTPANNSLNFSPTGTGVVTVNPSSVGAFDNMVIGATTPKAATITNLTYTGTLSGSTGVLNIGSGQLYKDSSGNVGVGTTSPSTYGKLTINGSVAAPIVINIENGSASTSAGGRYQFSFGGTPVGYIQNNFDGSDFNNTYQAKQHIFLIQSTEGMRLNGAANLLIGTTTDGMTSSGSLAVAKDFAHRGTKVGFNNSTPITKPNVTGSRGGNAALASLCTQLANLGLITDSTT